MLISKLGDVAWPPRSSDFKILGLNCTLFLSFGVLKRTCSQRKPNEYQEVQEIDKKRDKRYLNWCSYTSIFTPTFKNGRVYKSWWFSFEKYYIQNIIMEKKNLKDVDSISVFFFLVPFQIIHILTFKNVSRKWITRYYQKLLDCYSIYSFWEFTLF